MAENISGCVRITQRGLEGTQWNSGIWWREHCLWCKKVKPVYVNQNDHRPMNWTDTTTTASIQTALFVCELQIISNTMEEY